MRDLVCVANTYCVAYYLVCLTLRKLRVHRVCNKARVYIYFSDKLEGSRRRYRCGHTACGECVEDASYCLLCLTPPEACNLNLTESDDPLTHRVKNVSALFKVCQDSFGMDGQFQLNH